MIELVATKVCQRCGAEKPLDTFKRNKWGITGVCNGCTGARMTRAFERRRAPDRDAAHVEAVAEMTALLRAARARVSALEDALEDAEDHRDRLARSLARMTLDRPLGRIARRLGVPPAVEAMRR